MKRPKYVRMNGKESSTCLRFIRGELVHHHNGSKTRTPDTYFKDAGHWEVRIEERDGKLFSADAYSGKHPQLVGHELVPCTKEEWKKDNGGYV